VSELYYHGRSSVSLHRSSLLINTEHLPFAQLSHILLVASIQHMSTLSHYLPPPFCADICYYHPQPRPTMAAPRRPPPPIPTNTLPHNSSSTSISPASSTRSCSPTYVEHLSPSQIQALAYTARRKQTQSHHKLSHILGDAMLLDVLELELKAERRRSYTQPRPDVEDRGRARDRDVVTSVEEVDGDD
jgi:hypothetical protein